MTKGRLTRRQLGAAMLAAPAAVSAQGPAPAPGKAEGDLTELARTQLKQTSGQLRKYTVAMLVEPSFTFRA